MPTILIDNPTRNVLLISSEAMVERSIVASSFAATSIFTNYYCCFTVNAQAFNVLTVCLLLIGLDVVEDGIRFGL